MAFDDKTRGRLQKLVTTCRGLLTDEFRIQVQQTYGLDPNTGDVTPLERLTHLSAAERETVDLLRQTLAHYLASEGLPDSAVHRVPFIDRIVREQAFTVLNRLAALLMMEARGVLQRPAVGLGQQSPAFELYKMLAGSALGETGQAYQTFLFSLFDEFAQELPALFDRFAPQGRLFPREAALLQVLTELNHHEIQPLWGEDETIGWIYQYFNSKEERKAMRDASQAPRNSRELAVRNQFFTPRYVVEFLVDNTLGRLWLNATGGQSSLRSSCKYLLDRSDEQPEASLRLRDPRTLKILDPACGSMHFGLYSFDLFLVIYQEAWDWELQHGLGSLDSSADSAANLKPLTSTYADRAAYMRDVPRLVVEYNIFGVDIDPRAAQIAALALLLRSHRAWHESQVKVNERPLIRRNNIVAAISPPAERELRDQIAKGLSAEDADLFVKTLGLLKNVSDLGVLLRLDQDLIRLVQKIFKGTGLGLFADEDKDRWRHAEIRLRDALDNFAGSAKSTYQGRLAAQDSLQGLRIIDISRLDFDVVVMNPPFGKVPKQAEDYCRDRYEGTWTDVYGCFLWRFIAASTSSPYVGSITSSQFLYTKQMRELRKYWVDSKRLGILVELGQGVLDDATVETALSVTTPYSNERTLFVDLSESTTKSEDLLVARVNAEKVVHGSVKLSLTDLHQFRDLYLSPFCYHVPPEKLSLWSSGRTVDPVAAVVAVGNNTFDDFRFQRLRWEVAPGSINVKWFGYEEGGDFQPFFSPTTSLYNWAHDGAEAKAFQNHKFGTDAQVRQSISLWWKRGITYPRVSSIGFGPRLMPPGHVFSGDSISIFPHDENFIRPLLAFLCSTWAEDLSYAFGRYRKIEKRAIANLPLPVFDDDSLEQLSELALAGVNFFVRLESAREVSPVFLAPRLPVILTNEHAAAANRTAGVVESICQRLDHVVEDALFLDGDVPALVATTRENLIGKIVGRRLSEDSLAVDITSWLIGVTFGRWDKSAFGQDSVVDFFSIYSEGLPVTAPGCATGRCHSILEEFEGGHEDLVHRLERNLHDLFPNDGEKLQLWLLERLGQPSLRKYIRASSGFFSDHLVRYSKGARKAPIYWPISTPSLSYTLWIYYPSLDDQTLYAAINNFVDPRIRWVAEAVAGLRDRGNARTRDEEKTLEALQSLEAELLELRDKLQELASGYRPNHDDGVQVSASPLWPLFRHKPWQKILKDTWAKLEKGDYDWARLAMAYWPDRVREKCKTDKSLAIAHGLEDLYVEPEAAPKKTRGRKKADT